jgi:hypothetical protein
MYLFLEPAKHIGYQHLVGLLIQLGQFHGPDVVIPPLNACGLEYPGDQTAFNHLTVLSLTGNANPVI